MQLLAVCHATVCLVSRRITHDRDTEELLADECTLGKSAAQLTRTLDKPRRLRVEFHFSNDDSSMEQAPDTIRKLWEW